MNYSESKFMGRNQDQSGVASIVITIVMTLVIALIITGFAAISRREQRQALDAHLSTQALYAAESVINKTLADIDSASSSDTCPSTPTFTAPVSSEIVTTCAKIIKELTDYSYELAPDETKVVQINLPAGETLGNLHLEWSGSASETECEEDDPNQLPSSPPPANLPYPTNQPGMVRLDILRGDGNGGSNFGRDYLASQNFSTLLYPYKSSASTRTYSDGGSNFSHSSPRPDEYDFFNTAGITTPAAQKGHYSTSIPKYVGYTEAEWNKWRDNLAANPTHAIPANRSSYSAPLYGATSAATNWLPFWNWYDDYRTYKGYAATDTSAATIPAKDGGCCSFVPGQYDNTAGTSNSIDAADNNNGNFKYWANRVTDLNNNHFPEGDPTKKFVYGTPGSTTNFAPSATTVTYTGSCRETGGSPAVSSANIIFPSTHQIRGPYFLRIRNMYKLSNLTITPYQPNGTLATFVPPEEGGGGGTGAQVAVEVTARVQDVVKRIKVRVTIGASGGGVAGTGFPDQAIRTTEDLCKLLDTNPSTTIDNCTY